MIAKATGIYAPAALKTIISFHGSTGRRPPLHCPFSQNGYRGNMTCWKRPFHMMRKGFVVIHDGSDLSDALRVIEDTVSGFSRLPH